MCNTAFDGNPGFHIVTEESGKPIALWHISNTGNKDMIEVGQTITKRPPTSPFSALEEGTVLSVLSEDLGFQVEMAPRDNNTNGIYVIPRQALCLGES